MKDNESAFPVFDSVRADTDHQCIDPGISLRRYAAIHLKVPRSGDKELDDMIRQSRRAEFAKVVMKAMLVEVDAEYWNEDIATKKTFELVDAMLAEWEKEVGK